MGVGARVKGYLKDTQTNEVKRFLYNPTSFSDKQQIDFVIIHSPCCSYPKYQYVGTREIQISLDLYLRGDNGEVQDWINWLDSLKPKSRFDTPHSIIFAFGQKAVTCVVSSINRKFTEFDKSLNPIEATISLTLLEVH